MTNFARRISRPAKDDFPVRSLLDVDFYKPTQNQFIHKFYPDVDVTFSLINRETMIPIARIVPEADLRWALDHIRTLSMRRTDLYYLRGMDVYGNNMFSNEYLDFIANMKLPEYTLERIGDQYSLQFKGKWKDVMWWETIAMAAIMELYYRNLMTKLPEREIELMYGRAADKLYRKLLRIKANPGMKFADFGQRRRHSFLWQKYAVDMAKDVLGDQFTGTSNTYMAFGSDLIPIGTSAHELIMTTTALKMLETDDPNEIRHAQYAVLPQWESMYGEGLRIALPDTYGSEAFFNNMPDDMAEHIAHGWKGIRQDSGNPSNECRSYMEWLKKYGVDPTNKVCIFSDGLDVSLTGDIDMIDLYNEFKGEINTPFGWGTNFTADFKNCLSCQDELVPGLEDLGLRWKNVFKGFSLVCKVSEVGRNGNYIPAVKLSNNINKATGPKDIVQKYITIFGENGRVSEQVTV